MTTIINIAIGGAIGAIFRYLLSSGVYLIMGRTFPWGTLFVNVFGSLLMGFLFIFIVERGTPNEELRSLILIGLLGSFTTFSSFSIETLNLLESGEILHAGLNIFLNIICCLTACWLGMLFARQF